LLEFGRISGSYPAAAESVSHRPRHHRRLRWPATFITAIFMHCQSRRCPTNPSTRAQAMKPLAPVMSSVRFHMPIRIASPADFPAIEALLHRAYEHGSSPRPTTNSLGASHTSRPTRLYIGFFTTVGLTSSCWAWTPGTIDVALERNSCSTACRLLAVPASRRLPFKPARSWCRLGSYTSHSVSSLSARWSQPSDTPLISTFTVKPDPSFQRPPRRPPNSNVSRH